ncbi:MAG: type III pantothenate kinase [FCB group bacterium]|nr:type III pantothenate kinase [FCB group bacterium]
MILTLDVGNTTLYGGIFENDSLILEFRKTSKLRGSSDEMGIFLRSVLRENGIPPEHIEDVSICSVVPDVDHTIRNVFFKYFHLTPFELQPGVKTGMQIRYENPLEVGADRIANAIAATQLYPGKNIIVVDFGTATTFCVITKSREYLGGIIVPGMQISLEALVQKTAKLHSVEIVKRNHILGRTTTGSIQSGLYYGQIGTVREITQRITDELFQKEKPFIVGTGGFHRLFAESELFDALHPDLVLQGLYYALRLNRATAKHSVKGPTNKK